jgi:hypothetical protein
MIHVASSGWKDATSERLDISSVRPTFAMGWGGRTVQPEKIGHKTEANARVQRTFDSAGFPDRAWTNWKLLIAVFLS